MVRLSVFSVRLDKTYTVRPGKAKVGRCLRTPKSQPTLRRLERDRALIRANEAWRADRIHRPRPKTTHARNAAEVPDLLLHLLHRRHKDWRHGQLGRLRGLENAAP